MGVTPGDSTGHGQDPRPQAPRLQAFPSARPTRPAQEETAPAPPRAPNAAHPCGLGLSRWSQGQGWGGARQAPIIFPTGSHCSPCQGDGTLFCHRRRRRPRDSLCVAPHARKAQHSPAAEPGDSRTTLWSPAVQLSRAGARAQAQARPTPSREGSSDLRTLFLPLPAREASSVTQELQAQQGPRPLPPRVQPRPESCPARSAAHRPTVPWA